MSTLFDATIRAAIDRALRNHAQPMPEYARHGEDDYVHVRFSRGQIQIDDLPAGDADLTRPGGYYTYARRTTVVPLVPGFGEIPMFWSPSVFFLAYDDETRRPEMAYDGHPLTRGGKMVPVENDLSPRVITKRVFGHVTHALHRLAAFYAETGQRWEILRAQERKRCEAAGEKFDMPELPAVGRADKKGMH